MIQINSDSPITDILPFVKKWIKLIANGSVHDACALLDQPNSYGIVWTPELIRKLILEYLDLEDDRPLASVVSDPNLIPGQRDLEVGTFNHCSGYWFDYDVPLNGEWSDLTAQFEFYKGKDGYAVVLHDLHVL